MLCGEPGDDDLARYGVDDPRLRPLVLVVPPRHNEPRAVRGVADREKVPRRATRSPTGFSDCTLIAIICRRPSWRSALVRAPSTRTHPSCLAGCRRSRTPRGEVEQPSSLIGLRLLGAVPGLLPGEDKVVRDPSHPDEDTVERVDTSSGCGMSARSAATFHTATTAARVVRARDSGDRLDKKPRSRRC